MKDITEYNASLFLKEKMAGILVSISRAERVGNDIHISQVANEIDATYSHTSKSVKKLSVEDGVGYIKTKKDGRKSLLTLTDEGQRVASHLTHMLRDMDEEDSVVKPMY